jgi:hypothetical protein
VNRKNKGQSPGVRSASSPFQFRYPLQQLLHYGAVLATGTALACSGGKWANQGGVYLFFLPDSY